MLYNYIRLPAKNFFSDTNILEFPITVNNICRMVEKNYKIKTICAILGLISHFSCTKLIASLDTILKSYIYNAGTHLEKYRKKPVGLIDQNN